MDSTHSPSTDLSNCENEPIRYVAAVLPHGALLALGRSSKIIEAASESCQTWLGLSASHLLGQTLSQVFWPAFETSVLACSLHDLSPLIPLSCNGRSLAARSFCNDTGQIVVDIEPCSPHESPNFNHRCRRGAQTLRCFATESAFTQAATGLIRRLTDFDQVMIYRFDADWNGEVVAESIAPNVESSLGLHFPASDIPAQARELFKICRLRLIPDVHDTPSALLAVTNPDAINLGRSSLHSVSPIHIEYLRNMGARATLVGALVVDGRLWGLVSCQHKNAPKYVSPADREALTWLCEDIATQIEIRQVRERSEHRHSLDGRRLRLIASIRQFDFSHLMQAANNADLLGVVNADGFAMVDDQVILTTGSTPGKARIRELYRRYRSRHPSLPFLATHALDRDFEMEDATDGVAGALFVPVLRLQLVTLIWFRRERHESVKWSGNPQQPHRVDKSGRLSPRQSFALFLQDVRGQSLAWSEDEKNSAQELSVLFEINVLHENEALSRTILNSIPERIAVLNTEGVIIAVNDAWQRFAKDYRAPELAMLSAGVRYQDISAAVLGRPHIDAAQKAWAGIAAVLNRQSDSFLYDYPYDSEDEQRWFRMSVYPVQAPAKGAVVVHQSILERKRAEVALACSEAHLQEAQNIADQLRKLSVAVEQGPASVVVTDIHARIEYTNPRFTEVTGYSAVEVKGKNPRILQSGQVPTQIFVTLWQQLTSGQVWRGELINRRKNGEIYWEDTQIAPITNDLGEVTHYVAVKNETTDRKRLEDRVRDLAFYDPLTHLANRRLLDDRLGQVMASSKRNACYAAVMVLDLDNFKPLNDRQGHLVGDLLLIEAAKRLGACVRQMDTVARFGGDEFVVILGELGTDHAVSVAQAMAVAEKIRANLSEPYLLHVTQPDGNVVIVDHHCTASIGVVVFQDDQVNQTNILKWADSAMYLAKDAGRNAIRLCDPGADAAPS